MGAAVLVVISACGSSSPTPASSTPTVGTAGVHLGAPTVHITATDQLLFSPAMATANVGNIVQWTSSGTAQHTVTFDSHSELSDVSLVPGGTWEVKFTAAGTYPYKCTVHPGMNGTIVVS